MLVESVLQIEIDDIFITFWLLHSPIWIMKVPPVHYFYVFNEKLSNNEFVHGSVIFHL